MSRRASDFARDQFVSFMEGSATAEPKRERTRQSRPRVRARYDAAQTTEENSKHWQGADANTANGANSANTRYTLRNRARYETANNGYAKGLLRTIRNDVVGTGPRLQLSLPESYSDPDFGITVRVSRATVRRVERAWRTWCEAVGLAEKLRIAVESGDRDGECFALLVNNPGLNNPVKLDVRVREADQCTTPDLYWNDPLAVDGIRFDEYGNPTEYHFLKYHPGEPVWVNPWEYDRIPAKHVLHWYDPDRPNQARGIPSITPSLPLYSQLRRYTLATLGAAELAANLAGVMYTDTAPDSDDANAPEVETMDTVPVPRQALITLPGGWRAEQFKPEQPVSTYKEFKGELLTEAGRPMCAPRNVSTASSAEYNYSSARLDHLPYQRGIRITRERLARLIIDRIFSAWLYESLLVPGYLPSDIPPAELWEWEWFWDGFESIDPVKDATAVNIRLANGTATLAGVLAEQGRDWEEHIAQRAKEQEALNAAGLSVASVLTSVVTQSTGGEDGETTDAVAQAAGAGVQATALNGAQIASLLEIATGVVQKLYPADAAEAIVRAAFPLMPPKLVSQFIGSLAKHTPPQTESKNAEETETANAA